MPCVTQTSQTIVFEDGVTKVRNCCAFWPHVSSPSHISDALLQEIFGVGFISKARALLPEPPADVILHPPDISAPVNRPVPVFMSRHGHTPYLFVFLISIHRSRSALSRCTREPSRTTGVLPPAIIC